MEMLVAGRVLQGLGGGALTVGLYVVVGLVFPAALQPAVFASFAAAWVLPALFGPALAAFVAARRRLALGVPRHRRAGRARRAADRPGAARARASGAAATPRPASRLVWAVVGATAVLALELLGSAGGAPGVALAVGALAVVVLALRRLLPGRAPWSRAAACRR